MLPHKKSKQKQPFKYNALQRLLCYVLVHFGNFRDGEMCRNYYTSVISELEWEKIRSTIVSPYKSVISELEWEK